MASPYAVTLPTGSASFESVLRAWDESPQHAFSVELPGQPPLYGIWRPKWALNENDFDAEVVGFGWSSQYNTGNPSPMTRTKLSTAQAADTTALLIALFEDVDARKRIIPFSSNVGRFLGRISFQENWILLRD